MYQNHRRVRARFAVAGMIALLFSGSLGARESANTLQTPLKVRWLIAHEPLDAFRRSAKTFSEHLAKESNGQMVLEVLTPKDVGQQNSVSPKRIFELLAAGKVELSQTVTTGVGEIDHRFWVLDLPFLFKDHEHATRVLEGPTGQKLLAGLEKSRVRGLAFTYSGGFRVVPSTSHPIQSANDFAGMKVRTTNSPVAQETLRLLGAKPMPLMHEDGKQAFDSRGIDAAETTYIRVSSILGTESKFINETYHSLFLTSILASDRFYSSLSKENQEALTRAAVAAARIEREDSVSDGEKAKREFRSRGVRIIKMTPEAERELEERVQPVYGKFDNLFSRSLISEIRAQAR